jgi:hypothetical protein
MQPTRSLGEPAFFDDGDERPQLTQIHGRSPQRNRRGWRTGPRNQFRSDLVHQAGPSASAAHWSMPHAGQESERWPDGRATGRAAMAPAVSHYGSYNPLCMDVSIPAEAPKRVHDQRGSALPAGCPDRRRRQLGRHDRIWQDIAPLGHCCHCWVCATRRIFSAMADTLTLLLLVSMILAPVGLLAALATRHGCPAPVERAPQPIPLHNRYRGQPIR